MTLEQSAAKITEMLFWANQEADAFKDMAEHCLDFESDAFYLAQTRFNLARFRLSLLTEGASTSEETGKP